MIITYDRKVFRREYISIFSFNQGVGHVNCRNGNVTRDKEKIIIFNQKRFIRTKWGSRPVVVIADNQLAKKAYNHPEMQARADVFTLTVLHNFLNVG